MCRSEAGDEIPTRLDRYFREDLYGLAHIIGWDPYDLHHLENAPRVDLYLAITRSCTTFHNPRYRAYSR